MTDLATWRFQQRRKKFPVPPLMLAGFAALVGLVVFAALNRGELAKSVRSAAGDTFSSGGGGEKSIILAYLRENAGEPDSVELIKFKRFSDDPRETRWQVKFREQGPFGSRMVHSAVFYIEHGEVTRAMPL